MNKSKMITMCLIAMMVTSLSVKAQEVTITLVPGWNWISVPLMDTLDFETAMGSVTPTVGDIIKSRWGAATYTSDGQWRGTISQFYPGYGYHYKSNRTMPVMVTFTAQQPAPQVIVTTTEPTDITMSSAVCGGNVTSGDGTYILVKGICWATHSNPTTNEDFHLETGNGVGSFTALMSDLLPETTYHVRAYAVTGTRTIYGEEVSFTTLSMPQGAIDGLFTINENGNQVRFSRGNLQYQASTGTWRFAENQWDYVGTQYSYEGHAGGTVSGSDNVYISSTYSGWIDLFGWGTSGWNNGNTYYQPWDAQNNGDYNTGYGYGPTNGINYNYNLTNNYSYADWGIFNPISNGDNHSNIWRTLTIGEWLHVLYMRTTSSGIRFAMAKVNNVYGLILLPDDWSSSTYFLNDTNNSNASFSSNVIGTAQQWSILEQYGAVFLPVAGFRDGTSVGWVVDFGRYWSASCSGNNKAYAIRFIGGGLEWHDDYRYFGYSVRLVHDAE